MQTRVCTPRVLCPVAVLRQLLAAHAHDRQGLFTLCYYGARGCYAKERLSKREDGMYVYQVKRSAIGATELVLTAHELVKKIACLVPPTRKHMTTYYGVFASAHRLRSCIKLQTDKEPETETETQVIAHKKKKKPRDNIDWATVLKRSFGFDVFECRKCSGRMSVVQVLKTLAPAKMHLRRVGKPVLEPVWGQARGPPVCAQAEWSWE
jgi:hypothetical protein